MASQFNFRRIEVDRSGYYYPRWDRAVPVSVVAETEAEARALVVKISGECPRGRGWGWSLKLDSVGVVSNA